MSTHYLSISELNQRISTLLERNVPLLWVQGEISNLTRAASGHWYFSLKDANAQVRAVMFRPKVALLKWQPREGDAVQAYVSAGLYTPRGDFQLTVESLRPAGLGTLFEQFIQRKETLAKQGWFDVQHKKSLPIFPRAIGVVTSPQAAALRDVAHTLARRAPQIHLLLYPTLVQGESAAEQIASAIAQANLNPDLDAILLIRGGGSLEDLWAFNELEVAQAVFESRLPIICGVGHETDTSIADFVADVRAATPTAAAELLSTPTQADWLRQLSNHQRRLAQSLQHTISHIEQSLDRATMRLLTPAQQFSQKRAHLSQLALRLTNQIRQRTQHAEQSIQFHTLSWQRTRPNLIGAQQQLDQQRDKFIQAQQRQHESRLLATQTAQRNLNQLHPKNVLQRGFAYVQTQNGDIVYNANALTVGTPFTVQLAQGRLLGTVDKIEPTESE